MKTLKSELVSLTSNDLLDAVQILDFCVSLPCETPSFLQCLKCQLLFRIRHRILEQESI